jgi:hypothetical protein
MIKTEKKQDGFFDKKSGETETLVRSYANTHIFGYLSSMNFTPAHKSFSDSLNLDIVITKLPTFFWGCDFHFDYLKKDRLATRVGFGIGEFRHVHLSVDQQQINQLLQLFHKKIEIVGDEIALTHPSHGSFFWVDERAPLWMGLPPEHELVSQIQEGVKKNRRLNRTSCHSVKPTTIKQASFFNFHLNNEEKAMGSNMSGNFAVGAAAMSGYGAEVVKKSMEKARAAKENKNQGEEKSRQARHEESPRSKKGEE